MTATLKAELRTCRTKSEVKNLRKQGKVPAVVYGKVIGSLQLAVDTKELNALLRVNPHALVELDVAENGKHSVMIQEIQRTPIGQDLTHVDFHQINLNEPVRTVVTIDFTGESQGEQEGGMLQVQLHELEIRCLPHLIPASVQVDISSLALGETITVKDIRVPEGIEVKSDPEDVVASILAPQKEVPEETLATAVTPTAQAADTKKAGAEQPVG